MVGPVSSDLGRGAAPRELERERERERESEKERKRQATVGDGRLLGVALFPRHQ
jgi:hypothetical protein